MTRKEIIKRVYYWQQFLGLTNWRIAIEFSQPKKSRVERQHKDFVTYASIVTTPEYKNAVLKINPLVIRRLEDGDIVHELIHVVLSRAVFRRTK